MAGTTLTCKYLLSLPLWLACLVSCVARTQGQVDCGGDDLEQCEVGYFCDSDYRCKKCAACENFQPQIPCAESLLECGVCLDGYEFFSIGKCAVQSYGSNVGTTLFLVATGCSAFILFVLVFITAVYYIRKKRTKTYSCSNRYCPEAGVVRIVDVAPSAPEYPPAPPPYTIHSPQPAFNSLYNESSEPLLKSSTSMIECQIEEFQMARPYSQCVRLPPSVHSFDGGDENLNENMGMEENIDNEDIINSNELPSSRRSNVRRPVSGALLPTLPADVAADLLPLRNIQTISTQVQDSNVISCMETVAAGLDGAECAAGRSRPSSPADSADAVAGAQQVIVQFISNVSPILNLQGNNTR